MKKIVKLGLLVLLLCACSSKKVTKYENIDTNRALEIIEDGATIIDVRTVEEYNTGHIVNAINIPLDEITTIDIPKDNTLIIYCASGIRSTKAINELINLGYTSLYNLDGGLINWGLELEE